MLERLRNKKGGVLVEYGLVIAGVALVGAAAVATFGHKTTDLMAAVAGVLPGAHADDNNPILSGSIIERTTNGANNAIVLDVQEIANNANTSRFGNNLGATGTFEDLVAEEVTAAP